jgi:hypothetical protein
MSTLLSTSAQPEKEKTSIKIKMVEREFKSRFPLQYFK